jgi:purine-binding chemotaxis protein CheW
MTSSSRKTAALDWAKARQRLERSAEALEEGKMLTPEQAQAILEERARVLARVPPQAMGAADIMEVLVFALGKERYALETCYLREVLRLQELTPIPATPDFLVGICNVRGQILAVFDLRRFFGVAGQDPTINCRVLVLGGERPEFGVLADEVVDVARLETAEVLEAPGSVAGIAREYVRGVTESALILLDGAVLLCDPRLVIDRHEDGKALAREAQP